jgi:predicted thioesterase
MSNTISQKIIVAENQSAEMLGSGLLPVFATPALIALMENTAMQLITLPDGSSSVGTSISVKHLKASLVGAEIECIATLISNEGRKYCFEIKAIDEMGDVIGVGTHERYLVDIKKFMDKLK